MIQIPFQYYGECYTVILQGVVLKPLVAGVQVKCTAKNNYGELDVHIDMVYTLDLSLYYYTITFT